MNIDKKNNNKIYLSIFFLLIIIFLFYYFNILHKKYNVISLKPVTVNLLTSVHPNLSWSFKPLKKSWIFSNECPIES